MSGRDSSTVVVAAVFALSMAMAAGLGLVARNVADGLAADGATSEAVAARPVDGGDR